MRHSIQEVRKLYDALDRKCGVDTSFIELKTSTRSTSRLGYCKEGKERPERIVLSAIVMDAEDSAFRDVALHEYAHALVKLRYPHERHVHDAVWKDACREIGCNPSRTCQDKAVSVSCREQRQERAKYIVTCKGCKKKWYYLRVNRVVKALRKKRKDGLRCPECHGREFNLETR